MKKSTFIIPAVFTFAAGFALAQEYKDFDEVDTNGDGWLSEQELRAALPGLHAMVSSGAAGSDASRAAPGASGSQPMLTRGQIASALPGIEFDEDTGPIDESAYDKIIEELEERNIDATRASPSSATGGSPGSTTRSAPGGASGTSSPSTQQPDRTSTPPRP